MKAVISKATLSKATSKSRYTRFFSFTFSPLTPMGYGSGMVSEAPVCENTDSELCKGGFLGYPRYELGYRQPPHPYANHHGYQHEPASPPPGMTISIANLSYNKANYV